MGIGGLSREYLKKREAGLCTKRGRKKPAATRRTDRTLCAAHDRVEESRTENASMPEFGFRESPGAGQEELRSTKKGEEGLLPIQLGLFFFFFLFFLLLDNRVGALCNTPRP